MLVKARPSRSRSLETAPQGAEASASCPVEQGKPLFAKMKRKKLSLGIETPGSITQVRLDKLIWRVRLPNYIRRAKIRRLNQARADSETSGRDCETKVGLQACSTRLTLPTSEHKRTRALQRLSPERSSPCWVSLSESRARQSDQMSRSKD